QVPIHTFHSLGLAILREHPAAAGLDRGFRVATEHERAAALAEALSIKVVRAERLLRAISVAKRTQGAAAADVEEAKAAYGRALARHNWIDFDDLIRRAVRPVEDSLAALCCAHFTWIAMGVLQ